MGGIRSKQRWKLARAKGCGGNVMWVTSHTCNLLMSGAWCWDVGRNWGQSQTWQLHSFNGQELFLHLLLAPPEAGDCFDLPSSLQQQQEKESPTGVMLCWVPCFVSALMGHCRGPVPTSQILRGPKRAWPLQLVPLDQTISPYYSLDPYLFSSLGVMH